MAPDGYYHRDRSIARGEALHEIEQLVSIMPDGYEKTQLLAILEDCEKTLKRIREVHMQKPAQT